MRFLALLPVLVSGARMHGESHLMVAQATNVTVDPAWCSQLDPQKCTKIQERTCPITCGKEKAEVTTTTAPPDDDDLPIIDLTADTSQVDRLRLMKSKQFQALWPKTCDGKNAFGDALQVNTNGFICEGDGHDVIPQIISLRWKQEKSWICCTGKCTETRPEWEDCSSPISLRRAFNRAALGVKEIQTDKGKKIQVVTHPASQEELAKTGVIATVELKLDNGDLRFEEALPILTADGQEFLNDLGKPLAALLSMQITAAKRHAKEVKLQFCPHGCTTKKKHHLGKRLMLPMERAQVVEKALKEKLPKATGGLASVGDAIGHYKHENGPDGFQGGRYGSIIYYLYDGSRKSPECKVEDLYQFSNEERVFLQVP